MITTSALGAPAPSRVFEPSWAASFSTRLAGRLADTFIGFSIALLVMVFGPEGRPFAQDLVIIVLVAGIESIFLATLSATVGMLLVQVEVRTLNTEGPVPVLQAIRRSVPIALCYTIPIPGTLFVFLMPTVLGMSALMSPFRRAFHERLSGTLTVRRDAPKRISREKLELWWDPGEIPIMCPWGRVPDLHERRKARSHRLDGVWWLSAIVVVGTVITLGIANDLWGLLWLALAWIAVFILDETLRIAASGDTPGHAAFGFKVVDLSTGETPSRGRSLARAAVLAPFLYLPPLQVLLGLWVRASAMHRGPHDLVARTVVIDPNYELPQVLPGMFNPGWQRLGAPQPGWAQPGWPQSGNMNPRQPWLPHQRPDPSFGTNPSSPQPVSPSWQVPAQNVSHHAAPPPPPPPPPPRRSFLPPPPDPPPNSEGLSLQPPPNPGTGENRQDQRGNTGAF